MAGARRVWAAVALAPWLLALAAATRAQETAKGGGEAAGASPVKILLAMQKVYAGCTSYRDSGDVVTTIVTDGGRATSERPFATAFVRPGRFRFQFIDTGLGDRSSKYIVWSDGSEVRSWWDAQPGVRHPGSLQEALVPAAGISGGSSVRVPGLLLPEEIGEGSLLLAPERIEDGVERGVECIRIKGKGRQTPYALPTGPARSVTVLDETVTLWIDRTTSLLRKVEENRTFETYRSESTTTYTPEINVVVPAADLAFGAPEDQPAR
jgi:hypothetical protein